MAEVEEKLAEAVRGFPCLYDKSTPEFKDKMKKERAWSAAAEIAGLPNGEEAKVLFQNLRSRYSRDKKRIKSKQVSGTSTDEVEIAKKEASEMFVYLTWLDEYVQPRRSKSNFPQQAEDQEEDDQNIEGVDQDDSRSRRSSNEISDSDSLSS
ncbi:hypothetical protein QZH41_015571, partial [Actinostola sp. cb2023]